MKSIILPLLSLVALVHGGRIGAACDKGDPLEALGISNDYEYYEESCQTPSACVGPDFYGYIEYNYCSGGSNNVCCVYDVTCSGGYGSEDGFSCFNTQTFNHEGCVYKTGHCPGPSTYQCCTNL